MEGFQMKKTTNRILKTLAVLTLAGTVCSSKALAAPAAMPDGTVFDPEYYASEYPDVAAVYGTDTDMLYLHYSQYGKKEGRLPYAGATAGYHAEIQNTADSPDWVKALPQAQDKKIDQLFIVAGMGIDKTTATISMHEKDAQGNWKQILSTPGFVGRNGLCADGDHAEGCGQTPIGQYGFNRAFGIAPDPGCVIPYVMVDDNTYWSGDMAEGMHYNEMVSIADYPNLDLENSEHIVDYEYQYQYCLNISFNDQGTPGRGSAIFLHCFGPLKPYTGGCVAVPEYVMKQIMQQVHPDCVVVIDTFDHLNASF
jgi:L,D-peptidoglycan transpeptidase YkuD (ErfK/YbiS/YcfS/YnhG family)